jgi:hypothetical protein
LSTQGIPAINCLGNAVRQRPSRLGTKGSTSIFSLEDGVWVMLQLLLPWCMSRFGLTTMARVGSSIMCALRMERSDVFTAATTGTGTEHFTPHLYAESRHVGPYSLIKAYETNLLWFRVVGGLKLHPTISPKSKIWDMICYE